MRIEWDFCIVKAKERKEAMLANLSITNSLINHLSFSLPWIVRLAGAIEVKPSDVDGYGDYDSEQIAEMLATAPASQTQTEPDITPEEFEKVYQWFLS